MDQDHLRTAIAKELFMLARHEDVCGSDTNATVWLNTPKKRFNDSTPIDYALRDNGAQTEVKGILLAAKTGDKEAREMTSVVQNYYKWKMGEENERELTALVNSVFSNDPAFGDAWLNRKLYAFKDKTPLEIAASGDQGFTLVRDRLTQMDSQIKGLTELAATIFKDKDKSEAWLNRKIEDLGNRTPIEAISSGLEGYQQAQDTLCRLHFSA